MDYKSKLEQLIINNQGLILTKMVDQEGIPRPYLSKLAKEGRLEKVSHGVYLSPEAFEDEMYCLQARNTRVIFSHETALFLHDLTDRDPISWSITVPAGYNGSNLRAAGIKVYAIKKDLYELGLIESKTQFGRSIKTYDMERTICDIVRSRSQIDIGILMDALKKYSKRSDKSISTLMRYGEAFGITKMLKQYMEVLL